VSAFTALAASASSTALRVADVMHSGIVSCPQSASLKRVSELMAEQRVHSVVVTDDPSDATALWGVVSDLDLVAAASVRELEEQTAGVTATTPAITIAPADSLQRAGYLMIKYGTSHLVVIEPSTRRPVGVISTLDLATALAAG
jgi:CBS domain-containing protein